jgi:hypothetical protein
MLGSMRLGVATSCGLLALAVGLAGCGGSHRSAPPAPKPSQPKRVVASSQAHQLVSMRRIDGATWQTVVIRTDGTGDVGIFIGEWTGTKHKTFRVDARELARLDRLVAAAKRTPEKPYFGSPAPSIVYIVYVQRHVLQLAPGHEPRQLTGLTGMLSGLIDQYA